MYVQCWLGEHILHPSWAITFLFFGFSSAYQVDKRSHLRTNAPSFVLVAALQTIKSRIRSLVSPKHVPALVLECPDIPYTVSGKKVLGKLPPLYGCGGSCGKVE